MIQQKKLYVLNKTFVNHLAMLTSSFHTACIPQIGSIGGLVEATFTPFAINHKRVLDFLKCCITFMLSFKCNETVYKTRWVKM